MKGVVVILVDEDLGSSDKLCAKRIEVVHVRFWMKVWGDNYDEETKDMMGSMEGMIDGFVRGSGESSYYLSQ
ncbi:hypothetical protein V6N13_048559 [Hibiscus sabdariffa]|uniref:Uncharacterized protein n=1 Tax=Hibiscus sabdariffa TaxID=183260 RepID=A0ABR2F7N2_9ROSI